MYPYIENPAIARAEMQNEADWAYTYAKEEQEEADKEEAERLAAWHIRHSLPEILAAWVEADDLCEEDYAKSDQSDFDDFVSYTLEEMGEQGIRLPLSMPTYPQYAALKAAPSCVATTRASAQGKQHDRRPNPRPDRQTLQTARRRQRAGGVDGRKRSHRHPIRKSQHPAMGCHHGSP